MRKFILLIMTFTLLLLSACSSDPKEENVTKADTTITNEGPKDDSLEGHIDDGLIEANNF